MCEEWIDRHAESTNKMTASEKEEYKRAIEGTAATYGFKFSRHGCMCSGGQLIYTASNGSHRYELNVWHARGFWHLYQGKTKIGFGTSPEALQTKIQQLWDLDN